MSDNTTESPSAALARLGVTLPTVPTPLAAYVPAVCTGRYVYTSGQLPLVDGALVATGPVGEHATSPDDATRAAAAAMLNALAAAADAAGGLDRIHRILKITVFVASMPGFTGQPVVANGASELLQELFGERGSHARSAVGVASLPLDASVEIELTVEVSGQ